MKIRPIISFIAGITIFSFLAGQGCTRAPDAAVTQASKHVELNVWAVIDDLDAYQSIVNDYRALHPNVSVNYRRLRNEEYESELLNALAEDRGPDIFMIHNTWIGKYQPKILPMPLFTNVAVQTVVGTVKKEVTFQLATDRSISVKQYKNDYPEAVSKDTVRTINVSTDPDKRQMEQRIMAVPVSVDTLAMYVNKDLLNTAGIPTVPSEWSAFQQAIPKLVKQDSQGKLLQYGAGIGTGYNVERSPDILSVLMMQNGSEMSAEDGTPTFGLIPSALAGLRDRPPAYQALEFYTDFANPGKEVYTWNKDQPNSLEAFLQGKSAFFFGYSYHLPTIRARAPKLNLGIAPLPQIEGNPTVNYANYWTWTVSKKTKSPDIAWNFLNFMIKPEEAKKYLDTAKRPAAIKSLLADQLEDEDIGVFASQVLTAKSWYYGDDPGAMEDALEQLVENVIDGVEEIPTAVQNAVSKVSQTIRYSF
ncbi:MAG: extracellular solute-binding protein [Patescibacteria group bacterium]